MNIECKKLEVKGWIKLDKLALDSDDIETVVLRMSINPE
jgi:aspartate carbamoyltransferase regulatory subunit